MANLLSYGVLTETCCVIADSEFHSSIFVQKQNAGWIEFKKLGCGLHVFDTRNAVLMTKPTFINYYLVQTVESNKEKHASTQIKRAEGVKEMCGRIGRSGIQRFREILNEGQILNCLFTARDNKITE